VAAHAVAAAPPATFAGLVLHSASIDVEWNLVLRWVSGFAVWTGLLHGRIAGRRTGTRHMSRTTVCNACT
jgi:hypothetical protein